MSEAIKDMMNLKRDLDIQRKDLENSFPEIFSFVKVPGNSEEDIFGLRNLAYAARHGCEGTADKFLFDNYCTRNTCDECPYENKREGLIN